MSVVYSQYIKFSGGVYLLHTLSVYCTRCLTLVNLPDSESQLKKLKNCRKLLSGQLLSHNHQSPNQL